MASADPNRRQLPPRNYSFHLLTLLMLATRSEIRYGRSHNPYQLMTDHNQNLHPTSELQSQTQHRNSCYNICSSRDAYGHSHGFSVATKNAQNSYRCCQLQDTRAVSPTAHPQDTINEMLGLREETTTATAYRVPSFSTHALIDSHTAGIRAAQIVPFAK